MLAKFYITFTKEKMKKIASFLSLFAITMLFSTVLVAALHTDPVSTTLSVGFVNCSFYVLTSFNIIQLPTGILGAFIGAPGANSADGSPGIQVISTERDRAIHLNNSLKAEYAGKVLVPGYLRLEAVINNNNGVLKFPTFTGDSNLVYATEQRLDRNDAFIVSEYGMFLLKQDVANKKTNGLLYSYPNRTIFGAATDDLMAIFNSGKLNIEINKKREIPDLDCARFLQIPTTQQSAVGNFDEFNLKKAMKHATPQFKIDGAGTNDISVKFETYAGFAGASAVVGTEHRVVLYLHGFFVQGGSVNS